MGCFIWLKKALGMFYRLNKGVFVPVSDTTMLPKDLMLANNLLD
jgi:hypothetical protein